MVLERRTDKRQPVKQEVMLIHREGHRLCKIHDLSVKGALLELGWGALTRNAVVELSISLPHENGKIPFRVPAAVARVSKEGTAIEFDDLDIRTREALHQDLHTEQRTS